jgi:hypothetical protein
MTPEQVQQIIDTVLSVGGTMAKEGFELAVQRAFALAVADSVMFVIALLVALGLVKVTQKMYAKSEEDRYSMADMYMFFTGIGALLAGFVSITSLNSAILAFISPEWRALELLLGLVK